MKPTGYRVRHKETGQYYVGSQDGATISVGQVYKTVEAIKRNVFKRMYNVHERWGNRYDEYPHLRNHDPSLWEIVEFFSTEADGEVVE
jgi:hypothetical protein